MEIFVTPHAIEAFRCRLVPQASEAEARQQIQYGIAHALFLLPDHWGSEELMLWGCLRPDGKPFMIATDPADRAAPFVLVRTCGPAWFWHCARRLWQQRGYGRWLEGRGSRQRYRARQHSAHLSAPEPIEQGETDER